MDAVGVAVIGAGYWGPNLVRNAQACPDTWLRWVCDLDVDRAERVVGPYSTVQVTADLGDVLDDPGVDAVMIATPAATHIDVALAALDAGKHVMVEKPLASTLAEGEKLADAAASRGLVLMCDHTYCYTPAVQRIRDVVASGELGDIQYVDSVRINLGLVQPDIDVFWDLAPHDLSILDFVLPPECRPLAVAAHGADPVGTGRACVGYLTLPLPGGAIAHAHVNWLSPTKIRTTVIGGSRRTLVWDDLNPSQRISIFDRGVERIEPMDGDARRDALISYRTGDMIAPAVGEVEALQNAVREFASAIREGRPAATGADSGVRVLEILDATTRSLDAGGATIPLPGTTMVRQPSARTGR